MVEVGTLVVTMNISKIYLHIMTTNLKISSTITGGKFQFSGYDFYKFSGEGIRSDTQVNYCTLCQGQFINVMIVVYVLRRNHLR